MSRLAVAFTLLATTSLFAQDASRGGEKAVSPGGESAARHGSAETPGQQHAEAEAKHGEGHEEAPMPNEIWWKWANFAILAGGLGYLVNRNAGPFFATRSEEIRRGIEESARTRQEAEARAAEIEQKVSNLSSELERMRTQSREEIGRENERLRAETEAQLRKIQAQAESEIQSAAKQAKHGLKTYSAELALGMAEQELRRRMTGVEQEQITAGFAEEIRRKAVRN